MGIFIHLDIAKSVTQMEWEKVYEETLFLARNLPFAERRVVNLHNIDTICLVRTEERKETHGWHNEKNRIGWHTSGDYENMRAAEDYYLPRYLQTDEDYNPNSGDALLGVVPSYLNYDWEDEPFAQTFSLWGGKTQGEPYHIYLLAVGCLIAARLGEKAFVYGDITRGQCRKAVKLANEYLETPIEMPDQCYMDRLYQRIAKLNLPEDEKIALFEAVYLGDNDMEYGRFIQASFSEESLDTYWKKQFKDSDIDSLGFDRRFHKYLSWGNSLEKVCHYVDFKKDTDYEYFVKRVMDSKLHVKEKNCADALVINQEEERPYSIYTLMAQFLFAGAHNKKVDRFLPIEEIRIALKNGLGEKCNVDEIIDAYLAEEVQQNQIDITDENSQKKDIETMVIQDPADTFNQFMDQMVENMEKAEEQYDISRHEHLLFYEEGDTICPKLESSLAASRKFLDELLAEERFAELMTKSPQYRCEWIIKQNRSILIRDKDWEKIFTDIKQHEDAFRRYYPMLRIRLQHNDIADIITALMINDGLYEYSKVLEEQQA